MAGASDSGVARAGRWIGSALALILTLALVLGMVYAFANLEQLKSDVAAWQSGQVGDAEELALDRAADNAIGYAEDLAVPPPTDGVGRGYRFSHPAPAGVESPPAHWCAARDIGYRIDFSGAVTAGSTPAKEKARWQQAFAEWTEASGGRYTFQYRGSADYPLIDATTIGYPIAPERVPEGEIAISYGVPPADKQPRWEDYRHPALSDALGIGGVGPIDWASGPDQGVLTRGMIVLDALDSELDPRSVPVPYTHEAGHALGLSHVADPGQIMYDAPVPTSIINNGDRAGITRLASLPCS